MNAVQEYARAILAVSHAEEHVKQMEITLEYRKHHWDNLDDEISRRRECAEEFSDDDFWQKMLQESLDDKAGGYDAYVAEYLSNLQTAQKELEDARANAQAVKPPEVSPIPEIIPLLPEKEEDDIKVSVICGTHFSAKAMIKALKEYRRGDAMQIGGVLIDIAKFKDILRLVDDDTIAFRREDDYLVLEYGRSLTKIKSMAWIKFHGSLPEIGKLLAIGFADM